MLHRRDGRELSTKWGNITSEGSGDKKTEWKDGGNITSEGSGDKKTEWKDGP